MVDISPEDDSSITNIIETTSTELSTTVEILTSSTTTSVKTDTDTNLVEEVTTTSSVSTDATTTEDTIISIINPQIIVIPDETTARSTKATTITTTVKTTKIETTPISTTNQVVIGNEDVRNSANFVKTFTRGTYYCYEKTNVCSGSGRLLMDCSIKDDEIKGSVACRYIYEKYGYNYNGARTIVYLDIPEQSSMSGFYFIDDCCASNDVIDFFFYYANNCPFKNQGVLTKISCYIVPNGSVS